MADNWSTIIQKQIKTEELSLDNIYNGNFDSDALDDVKKKTQARSGTVLTKKKEEFDSIARIPNTQAE